MRKSLYSIVALVVAAHFQNAASAATWRMKLPASVDSPSLEITPLKYGKTWAYSVEIDDSPASTIEVSQPLLAQYQWSDAPAGQNGGMLRPFVGTAAVTFSSTDVGKSVNLAYSQIHDLKKRGWGIANHSYWHTGNHWEPEKFLKPTEFRRELFWSQVVYAEQIGNGRGATHFVFPNGDYHYAPYLKEFGLQSGSRVGASSPRNLLDAKANLLDWNRSYLDEGVWAKTGNALAGFPDKPAPGDFIIDFTHGMSADAESGNRKRWVARLDHIAKNFGPQGDNSVWVAPSDEVVNYHLAARAAKATIQNGMLTVEIPDNLPGSALTLKIGGVGEAAQFKVPEGGTLFHKGNTIWLTTPIIGDAGAPPVAPIHRNYTGEVKTMTWEKPVALAGVRLLQMGSVAPEFALKIEAVALDGSVQSLVPAGKETLPSLWGYWHLFPTVPDRPALLVKEVRITADKSLKKMEVWVEENT